MVCCRADGAATLNEIFEMNAKLIYPFPVESLVAEYHSFPILENCGWKEARAALPGALPLEAELFITQVRRMRLSWTLVCAATPGRLPKKSTDS